MGLKRGHRAKPLEWLAEKAIFLVSLTATLLIFLIFIFIGREALPVALGQMNTARNQKVVPVEQMDKLSETELKELAVRRLRRNVSSADLVQERPEMLPVHRGKWLK